MAHDKEAAHVSHHDDLMETKALPDIVRTEGGVLLDVTGIDATNLKLAKDGHTVLLPQPSDDPADPLLWTSTKKHLLLVTLAWGAFVTDFISGLGSSLILAQGETWHMNPNAVNHATTFNILFLGIGALFWVPLSTWWGRAPTVFWTAFIAVFLNLGVALSRDFTTFYAFRAVSGLISNAAPTISIAFIRDTFFFHQRARKIGIWTSLFIASPYVGPIVANYMLATTGSWILPLWVGFAAHGLYFVFLVLFLDECWYNREIPQSLQPNRPNTLAGRLLRVTGIWQLRNHRDYFLTLRHSVTRFVQALMKPVLILVFFNYVICFCWAIGINITTAILFGTPAEFGGYGFTYSQLGALYFTPVVGVFIGEVIGHFGNDFLAKVYVRRHKGVFEPEVRLVVAEIAAALMIVGLIVVGQALKTHLAVGVVVVGWGLHSVGLVMVSVTTFAYAVDAYPTVPAETAGWISFLRVMGGFSVGYFQQPWALAVGYNNSFGTQAATVAFGLIFVVLVHVFGHRWRVKSSELK